MYKLDILRDWFIYCTIHAIWSLSRKTTSDPLEMVTSSANRYSSSESAKM